MRFSLFGFPVVVQPTFWLVSAIFGAQLASNHEGMSLIALFLAIVFVSILVHELGHAFAMRAMGRAPRIELWAMGGLTHWGEGARVSGYKRALVSLAGPFAGFVLAVPVMLADVFVSPPEGSLGAIAIRLALWVNVGWGALNLLPIVPLDGGHVLEVVLERVAGARGASIARVVSIVTAFGAAAIAIHFEMPWAASLALFLGLQNVLQLGAKPRDTAIAARAPTTPASRDALDSAWNAIRGGRAQDAITTCKVELERVPDDEAHHALRAKIIEVITWAHIENGDEREALRVVRGMPARFAPSPVLAARLLLAEGKWDDGIVALERAYQDTPGDFPGLVLGAAYVDANRPDRVLSMLRGLRGARLTSQAHLTMSTALFYAEHYEQALAVSELAWNRFRVSVHAYNAACSCAKLGRIDEGLGWIETAVSAPDFHEREALSSDEDLAPLRADPRWPRIVSMKDSKIGS